MSIVWWNPDKQHLVADTLGLDGEIAFRSSKLSRQQSNFFGSVGSQNARALLIGHIGAGAYAFDNLFHLHGKPADFEGSVLLYVKPKNRLWFISVIDGTFWVNELNVDRFTAIGYGANIATVLASLGKTDFEIAEIVAQHVHNVRGPFEVLDVKGMLTELTED